MSLIYKGRDADKFLILDSDDGCIDAVDYSGLRDVIVIYCLPISGLIYDKANDKIYDDFDDCLTPENKNYNLNRAKSVKKDEFYTQLPDIERELSNYSPETFRDKIVYCPTDTAIDRGSVPKSQFVNYFQMNANRLQFKKLIATCFVGADETAKNCYTLVRGSNNTFTESFSHCPEDDGEYGGSGDFRSDYCKELLSESDIVVTNPPFSLFREFILSLEHLNRDFIILGSINEINFENVFNLFKDGKCRRGYTIRNGHTKFLVPNTYSTVGERSSFIEDKKYVEVGVRWYTNLDVKISHEMMVLTKNLSSMSYEYYDDSDILHVSKTSEIPSDFDGIMGVPVTFLDKWNPDQFELLGWGSPSKYIGVGCKTKVNKKNKYARLFIRNKR